MWQYHVFFVVVCFGHGMGWLVGNTTFFGRTMVIACFFSTIYFFSTIVIL